jgi:hypothetical protein
LFLNLSESGMLKIDEMGRVCGTYTYVRKEKFTEICGE